MAPHSLPATPASRQSPLLHDSAILHVRARAHQWSGHGPLSIKSFPHGQARYQVAGAHYLVDESNYLLLNAGQEYTIQVESAQPVESFCIFLSDDLAQQVYAGLVRSPGALLDDPAPSAAIPHFYERTYPHNDPLARALAQLRCHHVARWVDAGWREEALHGVMQKLLSVHEGICAEVAALPAQRAATRDELYRRLHRVRDYLAACYAEPLTLAIMAEVAALSPNHLLRSFRQLFRQSPHQYLRNLRIEQAKKLLVQSDASVTEICLAVGFESLGAFSWRFQRDVGMTPTQYRRQYCTQYRQPN